MLTIVATPIGNLKDITLRGLETLKEVDGIICEDSRRTSILLNHYQIKKPLMVLNDFNEVRMVPQIIEKLKTGQNLALVSDAGTPLISDPGYKLARECLQLGLGLDSLPGPSALLTALTLSGLPPDKFLFIGYPPEKSSHRKNLLQNINKIAQVISVTFIIFIAPFKLVKFLREVKEELGNINITITQELTKLHQKVLSNSIEQLLTQFEKNLPKGEQVLLFRI